MASTPQGVGRDNRMAVMREIVLNGPLSRKEIAGRVDLSEAALSRIAQRVIDEGLVRELERNDRTRTPDPDAPSCRSTSSRAADTCSASASTRCCRPSP